MAKTSIDINGELFQRLFQDPQRLREVIEVICQAAMSQEVGDYIGAKRHERTDDRCGHRNGNKPRTLLTRVGSAAPGPLLSALTGSRRHVLSIDFVC
jgi:transposase-like protein